MSFDVTPARFELPARIRAVVIFGGQSAEHEVSRISARSVLNALDPRRYEIVPVGIERTGQWVLAEGAAKMLQAGEEFGPEGPVVQGGPIESLQEVLPAGHEGEIPTVVIPILHGPNGEDGTIQGLLELSGLPYVSTGVAGSAVSMDKGLAKMVLAQAGIPQAQFQVAAQWDLNDDMVARIISELGFPIFVKPANMGSSVGVGKASDEAELALAIEEALRYDEWLVFEEFVAGREIEVGVLGNERPRASVPGEVRATAEFYDFDNKYRDGTAELLIPAPLTTAQRQELEALALRTYAALRAEVYARVDVFFEEPGRGFLVNEINTLPGFTSISMFPQLWQHSGLSYPELIDELVRLAFERHERRRRPNE